MIEASFSVEKHAFYAETTRTDHFLFGQIFSHFDVFFAILTEMLPNGFEINALSKAKKCAFVNPSVLGVSLQNAIFFVYVFNEFLLKVT